MDGFFTFGRDFSSLASLIRLLVAALLGCAIGIERGRHGRAAGMRTHILVCLGATLSTLVGLYASAVLGYMSDPLRVAAQVISGIGFLGAGTILIRDRFQVTGLTTAAGLWSTAAIGLAIGIGFYEAAFLSAVLVLVSNALLSRMDKVVRRNAPGGYIYAELSDAKRVNNLLDFISQTYGAHVAQSLQIVPARSGIPGYLGVELQLPQTQNSSATSVCTELSAKEYVAFAIDYHA